MSQATGHRRAARNDGWIGKHPAGARGAMNGAMSPRPSLSDERKTDEVKRKVSDLHAAIVDEVRAAVERDPVVVVGMAQNPFVRKLRAALDEAGIEFTYLEYGSYLSAWKERLAIKLWSGWPTFPQAFVHGTFIGGHAETTAAIADGSLQAMLDEHEA
jgi:glutaredoxin-related protein